MSVGWLVGRSVCLSVTHSLDDPHVAPIDLLDLVFLAQELRTIVLLGNLDYIQREWKSLKNFPGIFVMNGNPLNRADLRSVHINSCAECVILSAKRIHGDQDSTMSDKEAILCSLNIKAMVRNHKI